MKKMLMAVTLSTLTLNAFASAEAATNTDKEFQGSALTPAKQATAFTGAAVAGAAVGGPIGFIAGALGGAWLGEQIKQAEEADMLATQLTESRTELGNLAQQLDAARLSANDARELALESLEFQMLFTTGDDELQEAQERQVAAMADFLNRHPQLQVHLEGHSDPRGSDGYNNVLSDQRALSVQRALEAYGVAPERIERRALGASQSKATKGDVDAYALERRVDIHFGMPESMAGTF
ncbi:OmpA family protein [Microbulbifer hydrolyticus]|uniref:OmpA family protein n=1 Tax=Microbulbifer hydrolyticus TaxID=48074 RepID=A0A6P1T9J0_9GAMM|nr:OmpA family protein [Microbulbifer hydrolyticus]MBB5210931.1 outer membrane protein OmpA-like peptidoglycan-associated protein [Microbulbifer hydrolyticus]QHQ38256.1 OmpA family protein [Microbulbifer hydrolyticus]